MLKVFKTISNISLFADYSFTYNSNPTGDCLAEFSLSEFKKKVNNLWCDQIVDNFCLVQNNFF